MNGKPMDSKPCGSGKDFGNLTESKVSTRFITYSKEQRIKCLEHQVKRLQRENIILRIENVSLRKKIISFFSRTDKKQ
uniref:Uncharacterized protein n=1 Tax=Panagrolaimus sp. JU765 TaxID=591449 RepID=A0AC34R8F0_9BILA